jgi:hypothetical protein
MLGELLVAQVAHQQCDWPASRSQAVAEHDLLGRES